MRKWRGHRGEEDIEKEEEEDEHEEERGKVRKQTVKRKSKTSMRKMTDPQGKELSEKEKLDCNYETKKAYKRKYDRRGK